MISIDEAIENERNMVEAKKLEYENYMSCSIRLQDAHRTEIFECGQKMEYHEQLAELLEDYKRLKSKENDFLNFDEILRIECEKARKRAIDEALLKISDTIIWDIVTKINKYGMTEDLIAEEVFDYICKELEQLKGGVDSE